MNRNRIPTTANLGGAALLLGVVVLATGGCGAGTDAPPSVESLLAIENVGKWYQVYRGRHGGKPPENEAAFLEFINGELTGRGQAAVNADKLLTSPRDGKPYVVLYGKVLSPNPERNLVAYEQEGVGGKKLIVTELALSQVVDEAELQSMLPHD